jgi:nonsense-mediated mRNA decay protein 3
LKGRAFCPQCGNTEVILSNGLCQSCFLSDFNLISVPDALNLTTCTQCGSVQEKGRWFDHNLSVEEQAVQTIMEHVEVSESVENIHITPELVNTRGSILEFILTVTGKVLETELSQEYQVNVVVNKNVCNECSKYASGYYEAVIQLRSNQRVLSQDEISAADEIVKNRIKKLSIRNRMAYISQRAEIKEGVDYYIGSLKAARKITESMKNILGGVINESPRLMGHDKSASRDLYRVWILLRLPNFLKEDFVEYNNSIAWIINYDGRKIYLEKLYSKERLSLPWKNADQMKIVARKGDVKKALVSTRTPDSVQILHPETYQPLDIPLNSKFGDVKIGGEVKVVEIEGKFYLLK